MGVWVDLTKTLVMKNPAKGEVWVDYLNGGRPKWRTTNMEDDQNGTRPKWIMTKMEDDQNGRRPK